MKFTKMLAVALMFVAAITVAVFAAPVAYNVYATFGAAYGGGALTNSAIIGAFTKNGGAPVVTYLNVTAAHADATAKFYKCTNFTYALAATTNVRTNYVGSTNGFSKDTIVVVRHLSNDTYERLVCAEPQNTNIVFASDPITALAVGDLIYQQTSAGTIQCATNAGLATASIELLGDGIYSGQPGYPLLIDCITAAGTNGTIKAVNAYFAP